MDRTPLVKLLLISALSAGLIVPLFFYSRGLLRQAEQALAAAQAPAASESTPTETQDTDASGHAQAESDSAQAPSDTAPSDPAPAKAQDAAISGTESVAQAAPAMVLAQADKPADPAEADAGAQVYKPPLFGSCKRLFQQLQKQAVVDGEYKAFAFAFDGKTANCAEYVSNKSLRHARAVVLKNCQDDRAAAKRYVACLLYEVQ